ncbi:GntR family transcriptional regulator [Brachybacterium sp. MASK1Z-5]|uniref:GntR family transcriptional regulator n=1 Tax=Brachybacterium halotolerans TaxID=2795215 RepID=A0ABS1BE38_9MICO|nr:GntR family transcriptional regulator [Brachybacterium halotolerans]MBK0332879.1 GntR family transcriptional regulator [Brachybacterium halotolerans]
MTRIVVDLSNPTPPFEQVRCEILAQIDAGELRAGDRLPTIRALARDLGLAPGTVARSFKLLEEAGVIVTRRGAGTVVADVGAPTSESSELDGSARAGRNTAGLRDDIRAAPVHRRTRDLEQLLEGPVVEALEAGHLSSEILEVVREVVAAHGARSVSD